MSDFTVGCVIGAILGIADQWFAFICLVLLELLLWSFTPADAHCYSVWNYPWPQRCGVYRAQSPSPSPPPKPVYLEVPPTDFDIPLPSMDTTFPPDCAEEWCERLKGIGLLRDKLGTN